MPLSKARDKERKQKERANSRLDKLLSKPQTFKPVQPSLDTQYREAHPELDQYGHPREIDADGNPFWED